MALDNRHIGIHQSYMHFLPGRSYTQELLGYPDSFTIRFRETSDSHDQTLRGQPDMYTSAELTENSIDKCCVLTECYIDYALYSYQCCLGTNCRVQGIVV